MKRLLGVIILAGIFVTTSSAVDRGPQVKMIDQAISIDADTITLGQLFRLLDQVTGMHSNIPAEIADRTLSVHITARSLNDALRKIFEGQPFGYTLVEGQGVAVTENADIVVFVESEAPPEPNNVSVNNEVSQVIEQPVPPEIRMKPEPPIVTPTPFGYIWRPAGTPPPQLVQLPPVQEPPTMPFFVPQAPPVYPFGA